MIEGRVLTRDVLMRMLSQLTSNAPLLTRRRVALAYAVAIGTDVLQLVLGPFGWVGVDELLDVAAAIATSRLIGFHPLLLPTFVLKFVPVADMLPTWTGCVALVTMLRRREAAHRAPHGQGEIIDGQVIDVRS